jgi:hypothetical protein
MIGITGVVGLEQENVLKVNEKGANYILSTTPVGGIGFIDLSGIPGCSVVTIVGVDCSSSAFNNKRICKN